MWVKGRIDVTLVIDVYLGIAFYHCLIRLSLMIMKLTFHNGKQVIYGLWLLTSMVLPEKTKQKKNPETLMLNGSTILLISSLPVVERRNMRPSVEFNATVRTGSPAKSQG